MDGRPAGATAGRPEPIVMVRDIKSIDGYLWAVKIRTSTGKLRTVVIAKRLATTETVAMAAHVVTTLVETEQI